MIRAGTDVMVDILQDYMIFKIHRAHVSARNLLILKNPVILSTLPHYAH
jgi:hypothetical protein